MAFTSCKAPLHAAPPGSAIQGVLGPQVRVHVVTGLGNHGIPQREHVQRGRRWPVSVRSISLSAAPAELHGRAQLRSGTCGCDHTLTARTRCRSSPIRPPPASCLPPHFVSEGTCALCCGELRGGGRR